MTGRAPAGDPAGDPAGGETAVHGHVRWDGSWDDVPARLRARGLRWTPQRRTLLEVLASASGHVTGSELVDRCRAVDPTTIPSTVYRTLDVLEDLGIVRHAHGPDGREEFHVLPTDVHGHLHCSGCRATWEIGADEAAALVATIGATRGFAIDVSHLTIVGVCAECGGPAAAEGPASRPDPAPVS